MMEASPFHDRRPKGAIALTASHSHSIVPGGFDVTS